jgi:hypothetical protein
MSILAKAVVLYENEEFIGECQKEVVINCDQIVGTPKLAWFDRKYDGYTIGSVDFEDPKSENALRGVWIVVAGIGMLLNADSVDEIIEACNSCCGDTPSIPAKYDPIPAFSQGVPATYTITTADYGDGSAFQDFNLKYMKYIIGGTLLRTGYNASTGISTYTFQSYTDPVPQVADQITNETARVFDSNTIGSLGANQQYQLDVSADGIQHDPVVGATLSALVSAANADADLDPLGTFSTASSKVSLSSTVVYNATLTLSIVPTA